MKKRLTTKQKLRFLHVFVKEWAKLWIDIDKANISGMRVDRKVTNGEVRRIYAIVFQVKTKVDRINLKKSRLIPEYFDIEFPDGVVRRIKTDIEQTGAFTLHSSYCGGSVKSDHSHNRGSFGLFVKDFFNEIYAISNYHVLAQNELDHHQYDYNRNGNTTQDVQISNDLWTLTGILDIGTFSSEVDVGFVLMDKNALYENVLPNYSRISGDLTRDYVLSRLQGQAVTIYSMFYPNGKTITVKAAAVQVNSTKHNLVHTDLIQIERVTAHGDSGGLVINSQNAVVGIVLGADESYSYIVPFYKISNFKRCYPL